MITLHKSYSELILLPTFIERYRYLRLGGKVGEQTFGYERYLNQCLYQSTKWRRIRDDVIIRDFGCDLGDEDREIKGPIIVHHINPISIEDIERSSPIVFDLENLISAAPKTHQAIHYGDESLLVRLPVQRRRNDTCPWR